MEEKITKEKLMGQVTDSDQAAMTQAMEGKKQMTLKEIETVVGASIAMARPHVNKRADLEGVLEGMQVAWAQLANNLLIVSVAICALRHKRPDEIVDAIDQIWQTLQSNKADKFLSYRYDGVVQ